MARRCLCFHVRGLHCHLPGKSVGRRRLALRVYLLLYPAESEVAEFVCKFKCLLPHATLNFDLHVDPWCRWTRGSTKEENNLRSGCGLKDLLCLIFSFQLVALGRALLRTKFFCIIAQKICFNLCVQLMTLIISDIPNAESLYGDIRRALTGAHQPILPNETPLSCCWF